MIPFAAVILVTHGAAVGEVTDRSAVVWARSSAPAEMVVSYGQDGVARAPSEAARDLTARVRLENLTPGTLYRYRLRFQAGGEASATVEGAFRTAPSPESPAAVKFVVGGDLGGHGFCREETAGYVFFDRMRELHPDFFIANGDMIYADSDCPITRPDGGRNLPGDFPRIDDPAVNWTDSARVREIYLAHWRYNRADPSFQRFLLEVPMYSQWDDHEVINDFGAAWPELAPAAGRDGYPTLVRAGRDALFDFNPLWPHPEEPERIYRSFRWGAHVELFLLDARSYRSANAQADSPGSGKTLLGRAQLDWLKKGLQSSNATWKIVSSDVPLSIATGTRAEVYGRDAFADGDPAGAPRTGSENELEELLSYLDRADVRNLVFVVTDVHFATSLRYEVDLDSDGDKLRFHELVTGPLSAGLSEPRAPDRTFSPEVLYVEGGFFNFGFASADGSRLAYEVRDDRGRVREGSALTIPAESLRGTGR
jgi:alkaline phosphatase D